MSILQTLSAPFERRSSLRNPTAELVAALTGGGDTDAGEKVDEDKALKYTPFWAAVNVIAGAVGSLPFSAYRRLPAGKEVASGNLQHMLVHDRPNEYMSAQVFRETLTAHALTWGNGYAELQYDGAGRVVAMWPLMPDRTSPVIMGGKKMYEVRDAKTSKLTVLDDWHVLHIPGLGYDGLKGYSVVQYHRESLGLGLGVRKYASAFFGRGASPSGAVKHPGELTEKAARHLRESIEARVSGLDNAHRLMILEEGMDWVQLGVSPEDAQCLETQKFSIADISRIFQIPPHFLGDLEHATFSNIEHQGINFVVMTLMRWLRKWEQECSYKLFGASNRDLFTEFNVDGLLRGDSAARAAFYSTMVNIGVMSPNEIRAKENMNPYDGGDGHFVQGAMVPVEQAGQPAQAGRQITTAVRAHYPLLLDLCGRAVRKEVAAVRKAKTDEKRGEFYDGHAAYLREAIGPAINALCGVLGVEDVDYTRALSEEYVEQARRIADDAALDDREKNGAALLTARIIKDITQLAGSEL